MAIAPAASAHVTAHAASPATSRRVRRNCANMTFLLVTSGPRTGGDGSSVRRTYGRAGAVTAPSATPRACTCARSARVLAQRRQVQHDDAPALGLHPAERAQDPHRLGHRLARGARPRGELVLRDRQAGVDGAVA